MEERNVGSVFYEIEVYDDKGNLIEKKSGKGDSILGNWVNLYMAIRAGQEYNFQDTGGTNRYISNMAFNNCGMLAPAGNDSYGILVGTGTTSVSMNDYALASKIPHGTGSGQLSYGDTSSYNDLSDTRWSVGLQRSFDNNSGADITINEIGMVMKVNDGTNDYYVLIARDVISATTVPNGGRVTVKYWITWNP